MPRFLGLVAVCLGLAGDAAMAQVIEFQSNGLKYQTLTKAGVTVMYAHLGNHLHEYAIVQVAVSNGSHGPYVIRPEDFFYERGDDIGTLHAVPARAVIEMLKIGRAHV